MVAAVRSFLLKSADGLDSAKLPTREPLPLLARTDGLTAQCAVAASEHPPEADDKVANGCTNCTDDLEW